jgi:hypothetical protein
MLNPYTVTLSHYRTGSAVVFKDSSTSRLSREKPADWRLQMFLRLEVCILTASTCVASGSIRDEAPKLGNYSQKVKRIV